MSLTLLRRLVGANSFAKALCQTQVFFQGGPLRE